MHTAGAGDSCLCQVLSDFTGTIAGNRHYSHGTIEAPILYYCSLAVIHGFREGLTWFSADFIGVLLLWLSARIEDLARFFSSDFREGI